MSKSPMTAQGAQRLREELHRLKTVERPRITAAIAEARALGDLKENAEYHAAREMQSFTEGRIGDIESKLANAEIIDVTKVNPMGKVIFGATVARNPHALLTGLWDPDMLHDIVKYFDRWCEIVRDKTAAAPVAAGAAVAANAGRKRR